MKNFILLGFLILVSIFACSTNNSESEIKDKKQTSSDENPFLLSGCWIQHDSNGFTLIEISDTNHVVYYSYTNREKAIGETEKKLKHWFYKSNASLGFWDSNNIWIKTDKYRFDYLVKNDSLIEYDKMGEQGTFIRLEIENN